MGGSPCKAWNWRNPIVQTLFTQGPARTASVPHKRGGRPLAPARGEAVVPPGVLRGRRDSRNSGRGRPPTAARGGRFKPTGPVEYGPGFVRGRKDVAASLSHFVLSRPALVAAGDIHWGPGKHFAGPSLISPWLPELRWAWDRGGYALPLRRYCPRHCCRRWA